MASNIFDVNVLFGPFVIGTMLSAWLLGFVMMAGTSYFRTSAEDPRWIRLLVAALMLIEIVITIFQVLMVWHYCVTNFGNFVVLLNLHWLYAIQPAMTSLVATMVQFFFAWRVDRFTGLKWLRVLVSASALAALGLSLATSIHGFQRPSVTLLKEVKGIATSALAIALTNDVLISGTLVWRLWRDRTGSVAIDDILFKIIRLTMQTCVLTTAGAAAVLILFFNLTNNVVAVVFIPLSKLYTLSLLASLNARQGWKESRSQSSAAAENISIPLSQRRRSANPSNDDTGSARPFAPHELHVQRSPSLTSKDLPYDGQGPVRVEFSTSRQG